MVVFMQAADVKFLDKVVQGVLDVHWIHLFKNDVTIVPTLNLAAFDECDFDGYTRFALVWFPAVINSLGKGQKNAASITWVQTGVIVVNTAFGIYVTDEDETYVVFAERFPAPFQMDAAGKNVFYQPVMTMVTDT